MSLINENILDQSNYVSDIYESQTNILGRHEYPYLIDLILKNKVKTILDIGTGEGTFISKLAAQLPDTKFVAIDGDLNLIKQANSKHAYSNLEFRTALFDSNFEAIQYDLILARFAVEHMNSALEFVKEAKARLNLNGQLLVTEYFCEFTDEDNEEWKLFRQCEMHLYKEVGSNAKVPLILPKVFKEAGFNEINSYFLHISPSTEGEKNFYSLIKSYIDGYCQICPNVFTERVMTTLKDYFNQSERKNNESEDRILVSRTIGRLQQL
jgi:ubiquinone/menaquinone biosynthesis C-methylase UbiE